MAEQAHLCLCLGLCWIAYGGGGGVGWLNPTNGPNAALSLLSFFNKIYIHSTIVAPLGYTASATAFVCRIIYILLRSTRLL